MNIRRLFYSALALLAMSLAFVQQSTAQVPCSPTITPPPTLSIKWPEFRFDLKHSGCNPYEFILNPGNVGNLVPLWESAISASSSSPAVVNGVVYIGSFENNNVYALNAATGALIWKYTTGFNVFSSPAVANGVVYVGSRDGNVYALNAGTGALIWKGS